MSNEHLEKYKKLYSEYIHYAVELHNYHKSFMSFVGFETMRGVQKSLRKMIKLEQEMKRTCNAAFQEKKDKEKLEYKALKAAKKYKPKKYIRKLLWKE